MSSFKKVFSEGFEDEDKEGKSSKSAPMGKKAKIVWTKGLHEKFVEAVKKLGVDTAAPKKIVELMGVDGLTRDHVASHLQKYRIVLKTMSNKDSHDQAASISSSISNGAPWNISPSMVNEEQNNLPSNRKMHANCLPILDTSYFSIFEASNVNVTNSIESAHSGALPYEGYSMQAMTNNFDRQRNLIPNATNLGVVNSMNSSYFGFVQNLDGFIYNHGSYSTEEQVYNDFEIGSSSGVQNSSNFSVLQNPNGFESNYSSESGCIEMNQFYGIDSNNYLENGLGEDDLIMNEADIASLLSYVDDNGKYDGTSNNHPITLDIPNQDVNEQNIPNIDNLDSNHNELTSINEHHSLDGYLPSFDPNFDMYNNEQYMEPMWSPNHLADEMTLEGLTFNSHVQD